MATSHPKTLCRIRHCGQPALARCLCRKHYMQFYTHGKIMPVRARRSFLHPSSSEVLQRELTVLENQFTRDQAAYNQTVGLQARLTWRKRLDELVQQIEQLKQRISL